MDAPEVTPAEPERRPPRRVQGELRSIAGLVVRDADGRLVRADSLDVGGLPVLESFRIFLEGERRRARNTQLLLMGGFFLLLAAVLGAGYLVVERLRLAVDGNRVAVTDVREALRDVRDGADQRLSGLIAAGGALREDFQRLREDSVERLTESRALVTQQTEGMLRQAESLERVQGLVETMEQENQQLAGRYAALLDAWTAITNSPATVAQPVWAAAASAPQPLPAPAVQESRPAPVASSLVVAVTPRDSRSVVLWRLPLP